jgi:hypothetical protein
MLIVGIDVGIRNLAMCALEDGKPVEWCNEGIVDGKYEPCKNVEYVMAFVQRHKALLQRADHIVIERQLRANMRVIEAILHTLHWGKCSVVHARSVKARYGLARRDYRKNKQAAVEFVLKHAPECPLTHFFRNCRKRDDLADSYLLALFYSEQPHKCPSERSSQTTVTPAPLSPPQTPRRRRPSWSAPATPPSPISATSTSLT